MTGLRPLDDRCAILTDYAMGAGGGNCENRAHHTGDLAVRAARRTSHASCYATTTPPNR